MEADLGQRWRLNAGLRYDHIRYAYRNHLDTDLTDPVHKRPADARLELNHLSPKLGLIYRISDQLNAYAAYRQAFRIPSEGQLFRAGSNQASTDLKPVTADSFEVGLRGQAHKRLDFEVTLYELRKADEILNVADETGARRNINAGETTHRGVEAGADLRLGHDLTLGVSWTRTQHRFDNWRDGTTDYSGNTMPNAPRSFANVRVNYAPFWLNGGRLEAEWTHQGQHYLDEANSLTYAGHQLLNLRASYQLDQRWLLYTNLYNAEDKSYAETTGKWGPTYTPGRPRTAFVGVRFDL
jgi:outer membrane receptor protein involved in Fe transport